MTPELIEESERAVPIDDLRHEQEAAAMSPAALGAKK